MYLPPARWTVGSVSGPVPQIHSLTPPLYNTTLGVLAVEGHNALGRQTRLWCAEVNACRRLHGTDVMTAVSQTIPSGHRAAPRRMYAFAPHGALRAATV
jgi:hypothetical protein